MAGCESAIAKSASVLISLMQRHLFDRIWQHMMRQRLIPTRTAMPPVQHIEQGFTLLEMMIALAVFGLAALALIRLTAYTTTQTARLDDRLAEEIVAQNLAAEVLTDPRPPSLGQEAGERQNLGRTFAWSREVRADAQGNILRIQFAVNRSDLEQSAQRPPYRLEIIRQAPP